MLDLCKHRFYDIINNCFLFEHVIQPTRHKKETTPSVLNLVFTNEQNTVTILAYHSVPGDCDYGCLNSQFNYYTISDDDKY